MRAQFSVGSIQRSVAQILPPNSGARKTELSALHQTRSSTRIPDLGFIASHSHSVNQSGLGPIRFVRIHSGS